MRHRAPIAIALRHLPGGRGARAALGAARRPAIPSGGHGVGRSGARLVRLLWRRPGVSGIACAPGANMARPLKTRPEFHRRDAETQRKTWEELREGARAPCQPRRGHGGSGERRERRALAYRRGGACRAILRPSQPEFSEPGAKGQRKNNLTLADWQMWRTHSSVPRRHACRRLHFQDAEASSGDDSTLHAGVRAPRSQLRSYFCVAPKSLPGNNRPENSNGSAGRQSTPMNADRTFVFICVYLRLSAAPARRRTPCA